MPARRESIGGTGNGLVSRRGQAFLLLKRIWRPLEPILGFVRKVIFANVTHAHPA